MTILTHHDAEIVGSHVTTELTVNPLRSPHTGSKGQYTQWVHCEFVVGSETICPAHTQQINSGHFQKVPTNSPSPNPVGKKWVLLKSTHQFAQQNTQQVSIGCFQKVPINSPGSYPVGKWWALSKSTQHNTQWVLLNELPLFFGKVSVIAIIAITLHFTRLFHIHSLNNLYFIKLPNTSTPSHSFTSISSHDFNDP